MKITSKMLEKYDACEPGIDFLDQFYPNGAEVKELILDERVPLNFLHFGREYFDVTEEEIKLYKKRCKIDEASTVVWDSSEVSLSHFVDTSKKIQQSEGVIHSSNVKDSKKVSYSHFVNNSTMVEHSKKVDFSTAIVKSSNVSDSTQVAFSKNIKWSEFILGSMDLNECSHIYNSKNLLDCHFCGFAENSEHCMFSSKIKDKKYLIFNEEVPQSDYERYKEELEQIKITEYGRSFIQLIPSNIKEQSYYKVSTRPDGVFRGLSEEFYNWVETLPNYSELGFLKVFLRNPKE